MSIALGKELDRPPLALSTVGTYLELVTTSFSGSERHGEGNVYSGTVWIQNLLRNSYPGTDRATLKPNTHTRTRHLVPLLCAKPHFPVIIVDRHHFLLEPVKKGKR